MANQMIALQARAPQSAGLGSAVQQNAQLINMMTQQRAAERQAAQAQQKMALEAELAGPQLAEAKSKAFSAEQKALTDFFDVAAKIIGISKSPEDVRFGADMLKQRFDNPLFAQMIDQTIKDMPDDPQAFGAWRNQTKLETLDAKDQVPYFFEQVKTKELIGEGGDVGVLTTGGLKAPTIKTPRTLVPAPARTGTVNVEPSVPVDGGVGGPVSADDAERFIQSFPREAQAAIRQRINDGALGNIPMGSPVAPQSLVAGERGGVGGPYEAADEGYVEAATPFRAKNPAMAPYPGSAQVPISRIAAEKRAEAQATKGVELETEQAKKLPGKRQVSLILGKMRNAYEQLEKAEAIPSEKRGGFANAFDYLSSSSLGREAQKFVGTKESKYLSQIVNLRKALATAIKNATGMTAQEMNSNVELQLTLDTLSDPTQGIEAARQTISDLNELYGAPKAPASAGARRTPTRNSNIDALLKKYGD